MLSLRFVTRHSIALSIFICQIVLVQATALRARHEDGSNVSSSPLALASSPAGSGSYSTASAISSIGRSRSGSGSSTASQVIKNTDHIFAAANSIASTLITIASVSGGSTSNATAIPKQIGIVPAIPNGRQSPPLTSIPPVDPVRLSAIAADLLSINGPGPSQSAAAAAAAAAASNASVRSTARLQSQSPAKSSSATTTPTGRVFVSVTTFPLFSGAMPRVQGSAAASAGFTSPLKSASLLASIFKSPSSSTPGTTTAASASTSTQQPIVPDGEVTITRTITVFSNSSATGTAQAGSDDPGYGGGGGVGPGSYPYHHHHHHHHHYADGLNCSMPSNSSISISSGGGRGGGTGIIPKESFRLTRSPGSASSQSALIIPNASRSNNALSTITVQRTTAPPSPAMSSSTIPSSSSMSSSTLTRQTGGVVIIPIDPSALPKAV